MEIIARPKGWVASWGKHGCDSSMWREACGIEIILKIDAGWKTEMLWMKGRVGQLILFIRQSLTAGNSASRLSSGFAHLEGMN